MPQANGIENGGAGSGRTRLARRLPWIKPAWSVGPDLLRALRLRLNPAGRRAQSAAYRRCVTPADFFAFAREVFAIGQLPDEILPFLEFAARSSPERVCEIGTADGGTTFLLGQCLPTCRLVIGVDLYVKNRHLLRSYSRPTLRLRFISGSSRSARTQRRIRRAPTGEKLDLLFIDGDHSYEGVAHDFRTYAPLVRRGGLIALHDICVGTGTTSAGGRAWVGGVPHFWSEVKARYPHHTFVRDAGQHGFGIGAIRYDPDVPWPA